MWKAGNVYLAVTESSDGINWIRPNLNLFDHPELRENNVVIENILDGMFVFYDTNPNCPENEKYKAIGRLFRDNDKKHFSLWCFTSPDGYSFKKTYHMTDEGWFDSINTVIWRNGRRRRGDFNNQTNYI